jgi:hypothetical protein
MVQYDPRIVQTFAEKLYARARSIVFAWTLLLGLLGIAGGVVLGAVTANPLITLALAVLFCIVCATLGFMIGNARAFVLRLQAQVALCQVCIEYNTRVAANNCATESSPPPLPNR